MKLSKISAQFFTALTFLLFSPIPLQPFTPFYVMLYLETTCLKALWISAGCGLCQDLWVSTPFGLGALTATLTTSLFYRFRKRFSKTAMAIVSFTLLMSIFQTSLLRFFLLFNPSFPPLSFKGFISDFLLFPLLDSAYALLFFYCPIIVYYKLKKVSIERPLLRKGARLSRKERKHGP